MLYLCEVNTDHYFDFLLDLKKKHVIREWREGAGLFEVHYALTSDISKLDPENSLMIAYLELVPKYLKGTEDSPPKGLFVEFLRSLNPIEVHKIITQIGPEFLDLWNLWVILSNGETNKERGEILKDFINPLIIIWQKGIWV